MNKQIIKKLKEDNIPTSVKGFVYLLIFIQKLMKDGTKETYQIYNEISEEHNVTVSSVQRALRRAILDYSTKAKKDKKYLVTKEYAFSVIEELD